jgi:hypothetical protein
VTGRQITALTPTSEDATVQVLIRRLFESIDRCRVEEAEHAYQEIWSRTTKALPPVGQSDGLLHWLSEECAGRGLIRLGEPLDDLLAERQAVQQHKWIQSLREGLQAQHPEESPLHLHG